MLAGAELRRSWRTMVALGVVAALGLGCALGAAQLARRTSTAYERLERASGAPDAIVLATASDTSPTRITRLPGVARSWAAVNAIARVRTGAVTYVGVSAGVEPPPPGLFTPVIVAGRAPRATADDELLVSEHFATAADIHVGDVVPLHFLTRDEVAQFDTGFGEPDGPRIRMRVVGIARGAFGSRANGPAVFSTPAFARRAEQAESSFATVFVQLRDRRDLPAFRRAVDRAGDELRSSSGSEEFASFQLLEPGREGPVVAVTARVLVTGLMVFALLAAASALLAVGLALRRSRWLRASTQDDVLRALGVTRPQRLLAFVLAATPFVAVTSLGALALGVVAGRLGPLGSLGAQEPHPGWHVNVAGLAAGTIVVTVLATALVVFTSRRPHGRRPRRAGAVDRGLETLVAAGVPVSVAIGAGYAVAPGSGRAGPPVRGILLATALTIGGCVGVATFSWSLDRMVSDPSRWGWVADASVLDVNDEMVHALRADPRVAAITLTREFQVQIEDRRTTGYVHRGPSTLGWTVLEGRTPRGGGEVLLGARLARSLDVDVGDRVRFRSADGTPVTLAVVGLGTGPDLTDGQFAGGLLLDTADVARLASTQPYRGALLRIAANANADATRRSLGRDMELVAPERPPDVDNLAQLGRLPELLLAFLVVLGLTVLTNSLIVTARRRRHELDTLRAMGFVRQQVRAVLITASSTAVAIGLVVGTALGLFVGASAWRFTAQSAYVAGDAVVAVVRLSLFGVAALGVGGIVALAAAHAIIRRSPAEGLRAE